MRKLIYIKEQIWEFAKLRVVRNVECRKISKIANFLSQILVFEIEKNSRNLLIFKFGQFQKFSISKIPKVSNLGNPENSQFGKFLKFKVYKIRKTSYLENSKTLQLWTFENFQFGKFQKFFKFYNFENHQISEIIQYRKRTKFQNFTIWKP